MQAQWKFPAEDWTRHCGNAAKPTRPDASVTVHSCDVCISPQPPYVQTDCYPCTVAGQSMVWPSRVKFELDSSIAAPTCQAAPTYTHTAVSGHDKEFTVEDETFLNQSAPPSSGTLRAMALERPNQYAALQSAGVGPSPNIPQCVWVHTALPIRVKASTTRPYGVTLFNKTWSQLNPDYVCDGGPGGSNPYHNYKITREIKLNRPNSLLGVDLQYETVSFGQDASDWLGYELPSGTTEWDTYADAFASVIGESLPDYTGSGPWYSPAVTTGGLPATGPGGTCQNLWESIDTQYARTYQAHGYAWRLSGNSLLLSDADRKDASGVYTLELTLYGLWHGSWSHIADFTRWGSPITTSNINYAVAPPSSFPSIAGHNQHCFPTVAANADACPTTSIPYTLDRETCPSTTWIDWYDWDTHDIELKYPKYGPVPPFGGYGENSGAAFGQLANMLDTSPGLTAPNVNGYNLLNYTGWGSEAAYKANMNPAVSQQLDAGGRFPTGSTTWRLQHATDVTSGGAVSTPAGGRALASYVLLPSPRICNGLPDDRLYYDLELRYDWVSALTVGETPHSNCIWPTSFPSTGKLFLRR